MKKSILTIAILFAALLTTRAQIYFQNNYDKPVWVAIGYYMSSSDYKGWVTSGWHKVEPGDKKEVLGYDPEDENIYYYAQTKGGAQKFEGQYSLLVDPKDAFTVKNADKPYVKDENPSFQWYKFRQIDKGSFDAFKIKYTINFSY